MGSIKGAKVFRVRVYLLVVLAATTAAASATAVRTV